jgi:exosortase C (VPDSG-CTERM-specific)
MDSDREAITTTGTTSLIAAARTAWRDVPRPDRCRLGGYLGLLLSATLLFAEPLARLMAYVARSSLHSHILLVPLVAGYLLYDRRRLLPFAYRTSIAGTVLLAAISVSAAAAGIMWRDVFSVNDALGLMALAFVSLVTAGGFLFLGPRWMAAAAFPFTFLIFMIPLPDRAVVWLENALVLASADAAAVFYNITGTPVYRDGTIFELPGIALRVAQECSGIHSTWVLFITGLLASNLLLKGAWRRLVLVAFVIPLGIVRNGFRILVIGLLCVHIGPQMIDSPIHRRGGPIFFALSLIPLFLLLWWLQRRERKTACAGSLTS